MMRFGTTMVFGMAVLALVGSTGCSDHETDPTGHTSPVAARLVVDGIEYNDGDTLRLVTGQPVAVEVRLLDADGHVIEGIEGEHYTKLSFDPAELATSEDVTDHHFQKTVTGGTLGAGTIAVGYGHDAEADEKSFGGIAVKVTSLCGCSRVTSPDVMRLASRGRMGLDGRFEVFAHDFLAPYELG